MLTPEESRKLGWVPYVMDFSVDENMRFATAVATANVFDDLPQWVRDAADAADRKVGVQTWPTPEGAHVSDTHLRDPRQRDSAGVVEGLSMGSRGIGGCVSGPGQGPGVH
jgi:hypothetical protein